MLTAKFGKSCVKFEALIKTDLAEDRFSETEYVSATEGICYRLHWLTLDRIENSRCTRCW